MQTAYTTASAEVVIARFQEKGLEIFYYQPGSKLFTFLHFFRVLNTSEDHGRLVFCYP